MGYGPGINGKQHPIPPYKGPWAYDMEQRRLGLQPTPQLIHPQGAEMNLQKTFPRTEKQLGRDMKKLLNPVDPVVARAKREIHRMKVELCIKQHEALDLWAQKKGFPTYTQWLRNHKGN